jgi:hypothetical protein
MVQRIRRRRVLVTFAGLVRLETLSRQFYRSARFTRPEQAVQWTKEAQACRFAFALYGVG